MGNQDLPFPRHVTGNLALDQPAHRVLVSNRRGELHGDEQQGWNGLAGVRRGERCRRFRHCLRRFLRFRVEADDAFRGKRMAVRKFQAIVILCARGLRKLHIGLLRQQHVVLPDPHTGIVHLRTRLFQGQVGWDFVGVRLQTDEIQRLRVNPQRTFLADRAGPAGDRNRKPLQHARDVKVVPDGRTAAHSFPAPIREKGSRQDVVQGDRESSVSDHSAADELHGIVCAQVPAAGRAVPFVVIAIDDFEPDRVQRLPLFRGSERSPGSLWKRSIVSRQV